MRRQTDMKHRADTQRSHRLAPWLAASLLLAACGGDSTAASSSSAPTVADGTFARIQREVLTPSCAGCPIAGSSSARQSQLVLTADSAYAQLVGVASVQKIAKADGVQRIKPFRADSSLLYHKLAWVPGHHSRDYGLLMPSGTTQGVTAGQLEYIRRWIEAAIDQRRADRDVPPEDGPQDLLQALIEAQDPETGSSFSTAELLDQVCFLFLAGHETSASALAMATYLLSQFPDAQQRLVQEVAGILEARGAKGESPSDPLSFDELRQLSYGVAIFNETLRLYPPVSFFIREAAQDSELVDRRCPMRSLVTISPWVVQRHGGQWADPHGFRPERFLGETASAADRQWAKDAFLPFGLGPRKCPGAAFALQEALLVLAELVRRYELLPDPGHQPELVARLTLRSANGVRLRLRERP